jgi:hypothetical protein
MCQQCSKIAPEDAARVCLEVKQHLKFLEGSINEYLSHSLELEDQYRKAAIRYHCTQMSARRPDVFPEASLDHFEELFECNDSEWYNSIFFPLDTMMAKLTDLRDKYVRYHGTVTELYHRVYVDFKPTYESLIHGFLLPFSEELNDVFENANKLYIISRKCHETNWQGRRIAWHDSYVTGPMGPLEPRVMGEEWEAFLGWVGCLPETRRAVENGRQVSEIALDLLFNAPEGFEPETY